jgi:hypothetical protein
MAVRRTIQIVGKKDMAGYPSQGSSGDFMSKIVNNGMSVDSQFSAMLTNDTTGIIAGWSDKFKTSWNAVNVMSWDQTSQTIKYSWEMDSAGALAKWDTAYAGTDWTADEFKDWDITFQYITKVLKVDSSV